MHIKKIIISNFRGIKEPTEILFNDFTCIVVSIQPLFWRFGQ